MAMIPCNEIAKLVVWCLVIGYCLKKIIGWLY
jgi:hypothetical protein